MASPPEYVAKSQDIALASDATTATTARAKDSRSMGVFFPGIFRGPAMTLCNARGTALVILVVAVPTLVVSMILAARGSCSPCPSSWW